VNWLVSVESLDVGVHLNFTFGTPLTQEMRRLLLSWNGRFPGKYKLIAGILSRKIPIRIIEQEWHMQIDRCVRAGVSPRFLNSHEHIHQLPMLFDVTLRLGERFGIDCVRQVEAEWSLSLDFGASIRNGAMSIMNLFNKHVYRNNRYPRLLGFSVSGGLDMNYELMCHPGYENPKEIIDKRILKYHSWQPELEMLLSNEFKALCDNSGVKLIGFRDLSDLSVIL
jgi:predicted glycoside hydrolase/deacetylase ChbG (UPF0249 family)